ncbi:MAG: Cys-tRNA(Pro) deacylase [Jatrophihabitantaceae bacterium]
MRQVATGTRATVLLSSAGVAFRLHPYDHSRDGAAPGHGFGEQAAAALDVVPERIFKTLIAAVDARLTCAVVPVARRLDLKALAASVRGKRAELADPAVATRATGYVLGGISPLGQRSPMPVVLDSSASSFETVYVSAGRRGLQVELAPADLARLTAAVLAPIATSAE